MTEALREFSYELKEFKVDDGKYLERLQLSDDL